MNSSNPIYQAQARSGGYSARVPMVQGQKDPSPGPQVWFHRKELVKNPESSSGYDPSTREATENVGVSRTYVIRFGIIGPSIPAEGSALSVCADAKALIRTTVEGNEIYRECSIVLGRAIQVTCESVSISIVDQTGLDFIVHDEENSFPQPYAVFIHIAPGERGNFLLPPILKGVTDVINDAPEVAFGVVTLAPTVSARYPIPPNVGVVGVHVTVVDAASPDTVCSVLVTSFCNGVASQAYNPQINVGSVVLAPNSTYVEIENFGGADAQVTLEWVIEG